MLSSATETLTELRQIKQENRMLENEQRTLQRRLGKVLRQNADFKVKLSILRAKIAECEKIQREYDSFTLEVLTPTRLPQREAKLNIGFLHSSVTKETFLFPAKIQMLLQELQALPVEFSMQRLDVKRRTVEALSAAKQAVDGLRDEVEVMQTEAVGKAAQRRIRPMVEQKMNYIDVVTQMMGRFHAGESIG
jgi:hypothetical protein